MRFQRKDLIVLQYTGNTCYAEVTTEIPDEIEVNLETGRWTYKDERHNSSDWQTGGRTGFNIGTEHKHCDYGCRGGVIGVFDRTNDRHLNVMLSAAKEATEDARSMLED